MVRLESWIRPAGGSPVRVDAGVPGSRPRFVVETWRRLRFVLPWVRVPEYNLAHGADISATASDPQDGRNQPVAESSGPPDALTTA
jgi:hypothetical protein